VREDNIKNDVKEGVDWINLARRILWNGDESSSSIKCGEFLDHVNYKLPKKDSSSWSWLIITAFYELIRLKCLQQHEFISF
jgi:hypothetical protein